MGLPESANEDTKAMKPKQATKPMARERANAWHSQSRTAGLFSLMRVWICASLMTNSKTSKSAAKTSSPMRSFGRSKGLLCAMIFSRPRIDWAYGPPAPCGILLTSPKIRTPSGSPSKTRFTKLSITRELSIKARRQNQSSSFLRLWHRTIDTTILGAFASRLRTLLIR